jgi:hypothetical protein
MEETPLMDQARDIQSISRKADQSRLSADVLIVAVMALGAVMAFAALIIGLSFLRS